MQVKNVSKRKFIFADFEIKAGETLEVDASLQEDVEKAVAMYPRELSIAEVKKITKVKKEESKAEEVKTEEPKVKVKVKA